MFNIRGNWKQEKSQKGGGGGQKVCWNLRGIYFIEVGMLRKISWMIRYELGRVLISKNSKKVRFISIQEPSGCAHNLCQSALQKCWMAFLGVRPAFEFWSTLDSFLRFFFFSRDLHLNVFLIRILKIKPLF